MIISDYQTVPGLEPFGCSVTLCVDTAFGAAMNDDQGGKKQLTYSPAGKVVLIGAAATVLALINMSAGGAASAAAVRFLEYAFLTAGLIALGGGLIMMMTQK